MMTAARLTPGHGDRGLGCSGRGWPLPTAGTQGQRHSGPLHAPSQLSHLIRKGHSRQVLGPRQPALL